jgi:hypothetical protein
MKKRIEVIKKNAVDESKKFGLVILGFIGGKGLAYGIDKLAEKYPEYELAAKIAKPVVLGGGGLLLSFGTTEDEVIAKYLGYGLATAGTIEGLKLIPFAKDFLGGFGENINTYYTESDKPVLELGNFGLNNLPVASYNMQDAPMMRLELPVLDESVGDLGYNPSQVDLGYNPAQHDLGYNPSQTDDVSGIL